MQQSQQRLKHTIATQERPFMPLSIMNEQRSAVQLNDSGKLLLGEPETSMGKILL